jgi:hypothetical integral membrane protein (TIGR02206 family)
MPNPRPFKLFGPSHLAVLGATAAGAAVLVWVVRRHGGERRARAVARGLAAVLAAEEVAAIALAARSDPARLREHLPFQLCDWALVCAAVALVTRRERPSELAYYWGLAGTIQALLTPDLATDFPDPAFFSFLGLHGTVVAAILFLTFGLGLRPRPGSIRRAWLWSQLFAATAAGANLVLGTNYGYLRAKPAHASLLDYLGPWPWYILSLEALAAALFAALYAPFAWLDRRGRLADGPGAPAAPPTRYPPAP